jgi:hypothetical protein
LPDNLQSPFGAGMNYLPKDFADKYFEGYQVACARGGLQSGQGGSYGPSLAILKTNGLQIVLKYAETKDMAQPIANKDYDWLNANCERGFRDYTSYVSWIPNPDPDLETGYMTGACRGNSCFIDHPKVKGAVWLVRGARGDIRYEYQTECLAKQYRNVIYIYDPEDLAKVATGEMKPNEPRSRFYQLNTGLPGIPRSCVWDNKNQLLWLFITKSWEYGEYYPVWAAYRIVIE